MQSRSPTTVGCIYYTKTDGSYRLCIDYRILNSLSHLDAYPLPRIDDTLDALRGTKYFSSVDLKQGYYQIGMNPYDKHKTAFVTHCGLYQFKVMPFGLCGAPATFERTMEQILKGLLWERCLAYLDDVTIFGKDFQTALENLCVVFDRFRQANFKLNPKKCRFF